MRERLLPEAQPLYAGYVAWRGLAAEAVAVPVLTQELFGTLAFFLPAGEQFLGYPVEGPGNDLRAGHRSWNIVWYRPADEASEVPRLLTAMVVLMRVRCGPLRTAALDRRQL